MSIHEKYQRILAETRPFLFGNPDGFSHKNLSVFGSDIGEEGLMNCLDEKNAFFLELLRRLDALSFGPQGMGMDKWVLFDCAAMPSGIFGFALEKSRLGSNLIEKLGVPHSYEGLIPISMYMAIPTSVPGKWFGHNLSSMNEYLEKSLPGLGLLTKAFAARVFGMKQCYGATQWGSPALEIHCQLADLDLRASHLPAHTYSNSLCYLSDYSEENILRALNGAPRKAETWDELLAAGDLARQKALQAQIEKGLKARICSRPRHDGIEIFYPIKFSE